MPRNESSLRAHARGDRGPGTLRALALFKLGKALLLVTLGIGAFRLVDPEVVRGAEHWVAALGAGSVDREAAQFVLGKVTGLGDARLHALGVGGFLFAALFTVEGVGLWRGRRWAELLTVIATLCLIPVEIYELAQNLSWPRVSTLALNLTLAAYLSWLLWRARPAARLAAA